MGDYNTFLQKKYIKHSLSTAATCYTQSSPTAEHILQYQEENKAKLLRM